MALPFAAVPRLLDPRTWVRAMDDLHTLSVTAVAALDDLHTVAEVARSLEQVEARLTARIASGEETLHEAVDVARQINGAATELNAAAGTLATIVEPLQGATERLGRMADRLPGGRARARS